jgi:selenocysteine lyase/cysteine desulfurase
VDFRPNAGIRIAPHFYTTDAEVDKVIDVIQEALETEGWRGHERDNAVVT